MFYSGIPGETWIALHLSSPVQSWVPGEPLQKPAKIPGNKQLLPGNLPAAQICARDGFPNYQLLTIPAGLRVCTPSLGPFRKALPIRSV